MHRLPVSNRLHNPRYPGRLGIQDCICSLVEVSGEIVRLASIGEFIPYPDVLYMVPWDHAKLRGGERGIPHRSCRQAECLTDEAEKRLIVERLQEKGKRAAFERGGANRACFRRSS